MFLHSLTVKPTKTIGSPLDYNPDQRVALFVYFKAPHGVAMLFLVLANKFLLINDRNVLFC